ncbi:MAG: hypothetical protein ACSHX9_11505 [Luteolibacter sp.]
MKMKRDEDWAEDDATWKLLGEAAPKKASPRFADDTLRAARLLPEASPWWSKILRPASPWLAAGACAAVAVFFVVNSSDTGEKPGIVEVPEEVAPAEEWVDIEEAATVELLAAAADYPDDFSDQELVALIGF